MMKKSRSFQSPAGGEEGEIKSVEATRGPRSSHVDSSRAHIHGNG